LWFFKSKDNVEVVLVTVSLIYKEQSIFRITWPIPFLTTLIEQNMSYFSFKNICLYNFQHFKSNWIFMVYFENKPWNQIFMFHGISMACQNSWPLTAFLLYFYGSWNFVPFLCHDINYCYCNPCKSHLFNSLFTQSNETTIIPAIWILLQPKWSWITDPDSDHPKLTIVTKSKQKSTREPHN